MSIESLRATIPDFAKDLRLNLESVLAENGAPGLEPRQIRAIAYASAIASRHRPLTDALGEEARQSLSAPELDGVRTAAAIMAMTNIYYRFTHLVGEKEYTTLRAGLRMNAMASPGIDKVTFELCALAVSAVNGCGACLEAHEKVLRQHGLAAQAIQGAARIAAVVHAVAVTLEQAPAA
ncbi:MAG: carboxymuconolactone decarboxylase family protein [Arenimonas sp.]